MSDPSPLRLSEWAASPAKSPGSTSPPPPSPTTQPPAPAISSSASSASSASRIHTGAATTAPAAAEVLADAGEMEDFAPAPTVFKGFDLLRLPFGILRRWWIPFILGVVGAGLAFTGGMMLFRVDSTVSVRLMARNPQSFAINNSSYTPSRLQGATLLGALASPQVAREVASRLPGDLSARELGAMVRVEEVRRTDFVDIFITTHLLPEETAEIARLWAEEALRFTSQLQAEEVGEMRSYLEEQLQRTNLELAKVNEQIISMRDEAGVIDPQSQIDSSLRILTELNQRYRDNAVEMQSIDSQLISLRREIRKHSASFEELKVEEARLAELSEYYTEQNPVYQEARDRVDALRFRVQSEIESPETALSEFTGTYVGNALYLQILELEARRESLILQQSQLDDTRREMHEQMQALPGLAMRAGPLMETAQSLQAAHDALINRLKEVTVFQEIAPGYYRMFRTPTARDVVVSSRKNKLLLAGLAGGFFFFAVGALGAAGLEFLDATVRTPAEAEAALECPALAHILPPRKYDDPTRPFRSRKLYAQAIGSLSSARILTFWTPITSPACEHLWASLLEAVESLETRILIIHLDGEVPVAFAGLYRLSLREIGRTPATDGPCLVEMPRPLTSDHGNQLLENIGAARGIFSEIWVETSGLARALVARVLRAFPGATIVCALGRADRPFWQTQRHLLTEHHPLRGTITLSL